MTERPGDQSVGHEAHRLLQASLDLLLDRTRALAGLASSAGGQAWSKVPEPVPAAVGRVLGSLRQVTEQLPPVTAEIDVLVKEIHAKRLSIQALQHELEALDDQLAILERSIAPVQAWSHQWGRVRAGLLEAIEAAGGGERADDPSH